jgi:hypothetical protein
MQSKRSMDDFERICDLLDTIQKKDALINVLENKVASLKTMLDLTIDAPTVAAPRRQKYVNKKYVFYQEHKNDPDVLEQVELFKKTFPDIKKPPWQFVKAVTEKFYFQNES